MGEMLGNFDFLAASHSQLAKLGALAERYFAEDAPTALVKLRTFAEQIANEIAARNALLPDGRSPGFEPLLRSLQQRSILPRDVAELFHFLRKAGNDAAHEHRGSAGEALTALKLARQVAIWFHRTYRAGSRWQKRLLQSRNGTILRA